MLTPLCLAALRCLPLQVVTEDGLMRPSYSLKRGGVYCGGSGASAGLACTCIAKCS